MSDRMRVQNPGDPTPHTVVVFCSSDLQVFCVRIAIDYFMAKSSRDINSEKYTQKLLQIEDPGEGPF